LVRYGNWLTETDETVRNADFLHAGFPTARDAQADWEGEVARTGGGAAPTAHHAQTTQHAVTPTTDVLHGRQLSAEWVVQGGGSLRLRLC
jgi:hypothetical protein